MAKLVSNSVTMTCELILTEKETQMLGFLAGFGGETIAKVLTEKVSHKYSVDDWCKLWSDLRSVLEHQISVMHNTRQVFRGVKRAMPLATIQIAEIENEENPSKSGA